MTMPPVQTLTDEEKEAIRAQFRAAAVEVSEENAANPEGASTTEPPKRRRGRPPGSKNKPKVDSFAPVTDNLPTLASPPLSTRDKKEVATRLAGILSGVTGVASVAKPYFQMTDEEAEAIATPLASYLIRTEATSGVARQILDEYDVAAFVIAAAAYLVRVYRDFDSERKSARANRERNVTPAAEPILDERQQQSQEGEERPASRVNASASESGWVPSQL